MASNDARRNFLLNSEQLAAQEFEMRTKEIILNKVRLGYRIPTNAQIWADMHVSVMQHMDYMVDQVIVQFESTVFQEKLPPQEISKDVEFRTEVKTHTYEATNTWQFWKDRHQDSKRWHWLLSRLPKPRFKQVTHMHPVVHRETVTLELQHSVIYPKAKAIASPQMGGVAIRWVDPVWK